LGVRLVLCGQHDALAATHEVSRQPAADLADTDDCRRHGGPSYGSSCLPRLALAVMHDGERR
jgi:hypothetical protein